MRAFPARVLPVAAIAGAAVSLTILVVLHGWISDDAFISFRYAANLIEGHGPVYNAGERVQGYTHPLWLPLLALGLVFTDNALYVSVVLGAALTLAAVGVAGVALLRQARDPAVGVVGLAWLALLFASSEAWLSFQTSGLENSLSNLLIALLVLEVFRPEPRPFALSLAGSLLVLTRPDLLPLVLPVGLVALWSNRSWRGLELLALGTLPLLAWLAFALAYYGDVVPNTAQAKVGIYGSLGESVEQGWAYFADWLRHEPLPALAAFGLLIGGVCFSRRPHELALAAGALLYLLYVVLVGGDFMRGRFVLPFFVTSTLFGVLVVAGLVAAASLRTSLAAAGVIAVAALVFEVSQPRMDDEISQRGIVNERVFYEGFQLQTYLEEQKLTYRFYDLRLGDELKRYRRACGPVTIHTTTIGALGYFAGSGVDVIDVVGLTDEYIAKLPNSYLLDEPRPGHPFKRIPLGYLAGRDDISIFAGWQEAVGALDCGFRERTRQYMASTRLFDPFEPLR